MVFLILNQKIKPELNFNQEKLKNECYIIELNNLF